MKQSMLGELRRSLSSIPLTALTPATPFGAHLLG
jgi:hypothetical protein